MKFTVSSSKIYSQLQAVSRVIVSKNTLAILENVLFNVADGKLVLTASDAETTLVASLDIDNQEGEGLVAISARWLMDILKEFSEQPLTFQIDEGSYAVTITSSTGVFKAGGQNGEEYPLLPALAEDAQSFTVSTGVLAQGINKSLFCTADDPLRPVMNGVFFDLKSENLTIVATDAHKLVRIINDTVTNENPSCFILPKKPATLLKSILGKDMDTMVEVRFDTKNITFSLPGYNLVARQVDGKYPNYNAVLPQNNNHEVTVNRQELISAIKRVSVCANAASNLIKLYFADGNIEISAQDLDFSVAAKEQVSCQYAEDPIGIGFKSTFLVEILNTIVSEDVKIKLANGSMAALFVPFENEPNEDLTMLLMPMMLNS